MLPHLTPNAPSRWDRLAPRWQFLLVAAGLYLVWLIGYEGFIGPDGRLDTWLSTNIAAASAGLLRLLGFTASTAPNSLLLMDGRPAVIVGAPCDGLVLYALFAGFIVAFPGPPRPKLWFIPLGVLALYLLNIVRVGALALNQHYAHRSVDFNHHYTFSFVVYAFICLLWVQWVRWYGLPAATDA
ncbi:archaeosortase/exosortase family protein [Hymenobacter sp. BRD128]|uniref:exosortase X n=1 Tax=Hymenobacter sp. BRD128 TaxID=2675878 RepID=UPI001565DCCF|nr:archaeosortase/exosortase family protein [Hymenobacter sp. BRD128]QKG56343.1 archaeosortase/exosortase family protein [Hymenobacter sp. BRD128]